MLGRRWPWWVWTLAGPAARGDQSGRLEAAIVAVRGRQPGQCRRPRPGRKRLSDRAHCRTGRLGRPGQPHHGFTHLPADPTESAHRPLHQSHRAAREREKLDVRLGGIYALERIARDSAPDGATIAEVLTAFIRGRAPWPPADPDQADEDTPIKEIPYLRYRAADVQAALTVLGRQPSMTSSQPPNLSDTDLRRADCSNADLQATRLLGAQLQGANIRAAQLQKGSTCAMLSYTERGPTPRRSGRMDSTGRRPGSSCWGTSSTGQRWGDSNPVPCSFSGSGHSNAWPVPSPRFQLADTDRSCPPRTSGFCCRADPARTSPAQTKGGREVMR